jgi:hypothetical protein
MVWAWYCLKSYQYRQFFCTRTITNLYTRVTASPPVHSMWLQTVKFIAKKSNVPVKLRKLVFLHQILAASNGLWKAQHSCAPSKKSVINWTWLRLSISDWSIIIGPGCLPFVVPTEMQFQLQFYWWGCPKKGLNLRHLILLSRVTYWAPVEMLLQPDTRPTLATTLAQKPLCNCRVTQRTIFPPG